MGENGFLFFFLSSTDHMPDNIRYCTCIITNNNKSFFKTAIKAHFKSYCPQHVTKAELIIAVLSLLPVGGAVYSRTFG